MSGAVAPAAVARAANGCPLAIFTCRIHKKKTRALLVEMAGGGGGRRGRGQEPDMCVCPYIPATCNELGGKSPGSQTPGDPGTPSPP